MAIINIGSLSTKKIYIFTNRLENKLQHMTMWFKKFMRVDNIIIHLSNKIFYLWKHYITKTPWAKQMTERMDYAYIYFISSFDYRKTTGKTTGKTLTGI